MLEDNCEKCVHYEVCDRSSRIIWARLEKEKVCTDFLEVVRCKDCKNRDDITGECKHPKAVGWDVIIPEDNDFCSYGERKDNEG